MAVWDFVNRYFVEPTVNLSGYNPINTVAYIIALLLSVMLIVKIFRRLKIKFDDNLWYGMLPFVVLGGLLRASFDVRLFDSLGNFRYLFVTPLVYAVTFGIAFACILVSKYWHPRFLVYSGVVLASAFTVVLLLRVTHWLEPGLAFVIAIGSSFVLVRILHRLGSMLLKGINSHLMFGHLLDAGSTYVGVSFLGFRESMIGTGFIFSYLPLWMFIPLKAGVILGVLYALRKEREGDWLWMVKFAVMAIGLGPGVHGLFGLVGA